MQLTRPDEGRRLVPPASATESQKENLPSRDLLLGGPGEFPLRCHMRPPTKEHRAPWSSGAAAEKARNRKHV